MPSSKYLDIYDKYCRYSKAPEQYKNECVGLIREIFLCNNASDNVEGLVLEVLRGGLSIEHFKFAQWLITTANSLRVGLNYDKILYQAIINALISARNNDQGNYQQNINLIQLLSSRSNDNKLLDKALNEIKEGAEEFSTQLFFTKKKELDHQYGVNIDTLQNTVDQQYFADMNALQNIMGQQYTANNITILQNIIYQRYSADITALQNTIGQQYFASIITLEHTISTQIKQDQYILNLIKADVLPPLHVANHPHLIVKTNFIAGVPQLSNTHQGGSISRSESNLPEENKTALGYFNTQKEEQGEKEEIEETTLFAREDLEGQHQNETDVNNGPPDILPEEWLNSLNNLSDEQLQCYFTEIEESGYWDELLQ